MLTETEIRENLLDAGCSEKEMNSILGSICSGNLKEAGKQIEACRKKQLNGFMRASAVSIVWII